MSDHTSHRRAFLKTVGVSTAAISTATALSEAFEPACPQVKTRRRFSFNGHRADVLVVGGGPAGIGAALGAAKQGARKIYVHAFLDGRDTAPKSAGDSIKKMDAKFEELGVGRIASITGRYFAMDRDHRWPRIQKAYDVMTQGKAEFQAETALAGLGTAVCGRRQASGPVLSILRARRDLKPTPTCHPTPRAVRAATCHTTRPSCSDDRPGFRSCR